MFDKFNEKIAEAEGWEESLRELGWSIAAEIRIPGYAIGVEMVSHHPPFRRHTYYGTNIFGRLNAQNLPFIYRALLEDVYKQLEHAPF